MQNQFNKMSVFECQTISENFQKLRQEEFKDFQVLPSFGRTLQLGATFNPYVYSYFNGRFPL
jgi:hypothetical protein